MWALILLLITVLYGGVTFFAAISQLKKGKLNIWSIFAMVVGSVSIIISVAFNVTVRENLMVLLIIGLALIHIAAINNGLKMYEKIHFKHHFIRLLVSIFIVLIYLKVV